MRRPTALAAAAAATVLLSVFAGGAIAGANRGSASLAVDRDRPPPRVLSEEEAVRLALAASRGLASRENAVREQEARVRSAFSTLRNPELRLQDIALGSTSGTNAERLEIGLRWRPPRIGEPGLRRQAERVTLAERKAEAEDYRLELVADVREAYADAAASAEALQLAARRVQMQERRLDSIDRLVALGQREITEQVSVRTRLARARRDESAARRRSAGAEEALAAFLGEAGPFTLVQSAPPEASLDFDRLCALALEKRRQPELAREEGRLSEAAYHAERFRRIPWFSYLGFARHQEEKDRDWNELLIGIELPLFAADRGGLRAAAIRKEGRGALGAATEAEIVREIREALLRYEEALAAWRSLHEEEEVFLPELERTIVRAREQAMPEDEVIELELSALEVRELALEARQELRRSAIELCHVAGIDAWEALASAAGDR